MWWENILIGIGVIFVAFIVICFIVAPFIDLPPGDSGYHP